METIIESRMFYDRGDPIVVRLGPEFSGAAKQRKAGRDTGALREGDFFGAPGIAGDTEGVEAPCYCLQRGSRKISLRNLRF